MKLSNQYRVAKVRRVALSPEYSWVVSSRRTALEKELYNQAMSKFDQDLPFTNLFGRGVNRVVFPLVNSMKYKIGKALGKSGPLGEKGYDSIDWEKGEAVKVVPPNPKAPPPKPGDPPKEQRAKLGKALGRLPDQKQKEDLLDWWSANQETAKSDDYSIVVSRHPVDVLRMSDHEEWTSCHSPDGGHFDSCVTEMKHGGLVSYLVSTSDLQYFSPEEIAGKDEIFEDMARYVDGAKPVSRVRLRRFTHKGGDFDLAIPEMKTYGQSSSEFKEQITDWARKVQEPVVGQKRWRINEFIRRGGQYVDIGYDDAKWFNNFFGDNLDTGSTKYGVPGEEGQNLVERDRARIEEIDDSAQRQFNHCHVEYQESGPNEEGGLVFTWSAGVNSIIPESMIVDMENTRDIEAQLNDGPDSLKEYLNARNFYMESVDLDYYQESLYFNFVIEDQGEGGGSPTQYRDFCRYVYGAYDTKYDIIRKTVIQWLIFNEFAHRSPVRKFYFSDPQFQNFVVRVVNGDMRATAEAPVGVYNSMLWREGDFREAADPRIKELVSQELDRIIHMHKYPERYLPGYSAGAPSVIKEGYVLNHFDMMLRAAPADKFGDPERMLLRILFRATDLTSEADMQYIIELLGIVDKLFPRIIAECSQLLEDMYDRQRGFQDLSGRNF